MKKGVNHIRFEYSVFWLALSLENDARAIIFVKISVYSGQPFPLLHYMMIEKLCVVCTPDTVTLNCVLAICNVMPFLPKKKNSNMQGFV